LKNSAFKCSLFLRMSDVGCQRSEGQINPTPDIVQQSTVLRLLSSVLSPRSEGPPGQALSTNRSVLAFAVPLLFPFAFCLFTSGRWVLRLPSSIFRPPLPAPAFPLLIAASGCGFSTQSSSPRKCPVRGLSPRFALSSVLRPLFARCSLRLCALIFAVFLTGQIQRFPIKSHGYGIGLRNLPVFTANTANITRVPTHDNGTRNGERHVPGKNVAQQSLSDIRPHAPSLTMSVV
jgi:hypothetical protein